MAQPKNIRYRPSTGRLVLPPVSSSGNLGVPKKRAKKVLWAKTTDLEAPAIPPLDGFTPTAAYSAVRKLFSTYNDDFYTINNGKVSSLRDQSGNGRHLNQNNASLRPALGTSFGKTALDFTAAGGEYLIGPNVSEFITATTGFMIVSFAARGVQRSGTNQLSNRIISDAAEAGSITATNNSSVIGVYGFQYDGSYDSTPTQTIIGGSPYVVSLRKTATTLYCRVNLGAEVQVANGSLTALNYALYMSSPSDFNHNGPIYEFATWAVAPTSDERDEIVQAFMSTIDTPITSPDLSGYPDATTTGTFGSLTNSVGDLIINENNVVIQNLNITGSVTINGNGVTLKNCKITSGGFATVNMVGDNVTVSRCEINGNIGLGTRGVNVVGDNSTIEYCNIYNCEDGIYLTGSDGITITNNYIHDLNSSEASPHYDGIATDGGITHVLIRHNTVLNSFTQTSSVMIANTFAGCSNILIDNNYLAGGGYTLYVDAQFGGGPITNVSVTNNYVSKGSTGFFNFNATTPSSSGNREAQTGTLLA